MQTLMCFFFLMACGTLHESLDRLRLGRAAEATLRELDIAPLAEVRAAEPLGADIVLWVDRSGVRIDESLHWDRLARERGYSFTGAGDPREIIPFEGGDDLYMSDLGVGLLALRERLLSDITLLPEAHIVIAANADLPYRDLARTIYTVAQSRLEPHGVVVRVARTPGVLEILLPRFCADGERPYGKIDPVTRPSREIALERDLVADIVGNLGNRANLDPCSEPVVTVMNAGATVSSFPGLPGNLGACGGMVIGEDASNEPCEWIPHCGGRMDEEGIAVAVQRVLDRDPGCEIALLGAGNEVHISDLAPILALLRNTPGNQGVMLAVPNDPREGCR